MNEIIGYEENWISIIFNSFCMFINVSYSIATLMTDYKKPWCYNSILNILLLQSSSLESGKCNSESVNCKRQYHSIGLLPNSTSVKMETAQLPPHEHECLSITNKEVINVLRMNYVLIGVIGGTF